MITLLVIYGIFTVAGIVYFANISMLSTAAEAVVLFALLSILGACGLKIISKVQGTDEKVYEPGEAGTLRGAYYVLFAENFGFMLVSFLETALYLLF